MSLQEIQQFWDTYADEYERVADESTSQLFHQLLTFIPLSSCSSILETGCGTGSGLEILRKSLPATCKIVGSDYSTAMVQKSISKSVANCEVHQEDSQQLSFLSNSFDAYIANLSLHIVPDALQMLKEAHRVLKPGSTAVFSVWGKQEATNMFQIASRAQLAVISNQVAGPDESKPRSPFYLNDQQLLNRLAQEAGFVYVKSFYTSIPLNIVSGDEFVDVIKSEPKLLDLKAKNLELYERLLDQAKTEAERVLASGSHITFDGLVLVGEKSGAEGVASE